MTPVAGSDFVAATGTLSFAEGSPSGTPQSFQVTTSGDVLDEPNQTFAIVLTQAPGATLGGPSTQTVTILDDDAPPVVSVNDAMVAEGNTGTTLATFNVTLSTISGKTVTVNYATENGTATPAVDYQALAGTLTFPPGTTALTAHVVVYGDTADEPFETFQMMLMSPVGAGLGDATADGTIANDDGTPQITIGNASVAEGQSGTVSAAFAVTLSFGSTQSVSVTYATANLTATAGRDYTATSGVLTFPIGTTSQWITVVVHGNTVVEPTETFAVNLSNPVSAALNGSQGIGTITNDDGPFTDDPLQPGMTPIRVVHLTELRTNINELRALYGLGTVTWTDPVLTAGVTTVRREHLLELRAALEAVYQQAGITPPTYTDSVVVAGVTPIRAVHLQELRAAIKAVP